MPRYIEADKIKAHINSNTWQTEFVITIAEEVAPVIHAKWFKSNYDFICTNCGIHSKGYHNYCSNCGAKMDKE